jgi:hypothetical protein
MELSAREDVPGKIRDDVRSEPRSGIHSYARISSGRWTASGQPAKVIADMLGGSAPSLIICSGNGAPCATSPTASLARELSGDDTTVIRPQLFAQGLAGTGALFHLILGLSSNSVTRSAGAQALLLGTARDNGFAAVLLELP